MKKHFALIVIACLAGACVMAPVPRQDNNSVSIQTQFDSAWSAALETMAELGLPIMNSEKASGLITTDWISFKNQNDETGYCACGPTKLPLVDVDRRGKFRIFINTTEKSAEVKVSAIFEKISQYKDIVENTPCVSTGKLEAEISKRVSEKSR